MIEQEQILITKKYERLALTLALAITFKYSAFFMQLTRRRNLKL
jgi:hypothetical protein